jgi:stage II sporulation SpoE-like protein/histidine kinase-like protein
MAQGGIVPVGSHQRPAPASPRRRAPGADRERTASEYAAALARAELLDSLSVHLGRSPDPETLARRLVERVTERFGDVAVWLHDERGLCRVAGRLPGVAAAEVASAFRTGDLQIAAEPAGRTVVALPLLADGAVLGVLAIARDGELGPDVVSVALAVAVRAGRALVDVARLQHEHAIVDACRGPAVRPDLCVPGIDVGAHHRPGGRAGGATWYDAVELDDGFLFFGLGRVLDGGPAAVALMTQVRAAIRAYVVDYPSPAAVLSGIDRLFDVVREERTVTTVAGIADPASGEVWLANAGHAAPLLVTASGSATPLDEARSAPLGPGGGGGRGGRGERPEHRLVLRRGDAVLLRAGEWPGHDLADEPRLATGTGVPAGRALDRWVAGLATLMADQPTGEPPGGVAVLAIRYAGRRRSVRPARGDRESASGPAAGAAPRLQLPPLASSALASRQWVADRLAGLSSELVDTATLLTSELVTNAVLHAGTDVIVSIHRGDERIRVDVADGSPVEPVHKDYPTDAATGRGLILFDHLASAWGTRPIIPIGKIVWFELPVDAPGDAFEPGALPFDLDAPFDLDGLFDLDELAVPFDRPPATRPGPAGPPVPVRLLDVPVAVLNRAAEQYEALFREFRLVVEQGPANPGGAPERLLALIDELGTRFAGFAVGMDQDWRTAVTRGDGAVDLELDVPAAVGPACEHYDQLLDQADHFCRAAELITLPATRETVALRKWLLLEFSRQVAGQPPVPWPQSVWARGGQ